jgi:hypothetical protein
VERRQSGKVAFSVQAAEKASMSPLRSPRERRRALSVPRADNAIYALSAALGRLAAYRARSA